MIKLKIKTGDTVKVIAGAYKSTKDNAVTGKVIKVFKEENKAIVEGVNMVKKHAKPSATNPQGGIIEKEAPIHISNLALMTTSGDATRVGYRMENDKKVRFAKKSNEVI